MRWELGGWRFQWPSEGVRLMGVLNVTPDSFSDGGLFLEPAVALSRARRLVAEGADLIDVGGESSRPGARPVDADEELRRVLPVVEALASAVAVPISVDTTKAAVARAALAAGASVINDISAGEGDPSMFATVAAAGAGLILMHMRGTPATMQLGDLSAEDRVGEIGEFLERRMEAAVSEGVAAEAICVDPGIGFGKTPEQNLELLVSTSRLSQLGRPVLLGPSRKSFLGHFTGRGVGERLASTTAACTVAALSGTHLLRVHDVGEARDVVKLVAALRRLPALASTGHGRSGSDLGGAA